MGGPRRNPHFDVQDSVLGGRSDGDITDAHSDVITWLWSGWKATSQYKCNPETSLVEKGFETDCPPTPENL